MLATTGRLAAAATGVLVAGALALAGCSDRSGPPASPPPVSGSASASAPPGTSSPPTAGGRPPVAPSEVDVLRRFGVPLPGCPATNVKYVVSGALYLRFDADAACVDEYLRDLMIADIAGPVAVRPSAVAAQCQAIGWCLDPGRSYDYYSAFTTPTVEAELFVDSAKSPQTVYLRAAASR
jgi:hypothetical protein